MPPWTSRIFEGTIRDWWVYVPAQYKPDGSASLMVFQDGHDFVNTKGNWRVPIVFDNLIARGEMPPTIGVFINPGHAAAKGDEFHEIKWKASNRSLEYDTLGDRYARYLVEEILPEVRKQWPLAMIPQCGRSAEPRAAGSARLPLPGSDLINFERCFRQSGHLRIFAEATPTRR